MHISQGIIIIQFNFKNVFVGWRNGSITIYHVLFIVEKTRGFNPEMEEEKGRERGQRQLKGLMKDVLCSATERIIPQWFVGISQVKDHEAESHVKA